MLSFLNIVLNLTKYFRRGNKYKQMQCYYCKYIYSLIAYVGMNMREMDVKKTQFVSVKYLVWFA